MPLDLHAKNLGRMPTFRDYTIFTTSVKTLYWASWRTEQQPQSWEEWRSDTLEYHRMVCTLVRTEGRYISLERYVPREDVYQWLAIT